MGQVSTGASPFASHVITWIIESSRIGTPGQEPTARVPIEITLYCQSFYSQNYSGLSNISGPLCQPNKAVMLRYCHHYKLHDESRGHLCNYDAHRLGWTLSIYKKLKQLKSFFTKIRSTVLLAEAPLVSPKGLTKEGKIGFLNESHQNLNTFYTSNFLYLPLIPVYYFPLAHTFTFLFTCIHP